jgi:hypothetical protein
LGWNLDHRWYSHSYGRFICFRTIGNSIAIKQARPQGMANFLANRAISVEQGGKDQRIVRKSGPGFPRTTMRRSRDRASDRSQK